MPISRTVRAKLRWEAPAVALERWNPGILAVLPADETTINIYSTIGEYGDGAGMTPRIVSSILRKADGKAVNVNINSPGGDFFDGLAIHTLLSEYEGDVKVNILGMAASAASVVALAGDEIKIAEAGFFMIHNSWSIAIGNRHDMAEVAEMLEKFDTSMTNLYAKATGIDKKTIARMMDSESWIDGQEAIEQGFAHSLLGDEEVLVEDKPKAEYNAALKKIDVALAKAGMPRTERRDLIKELTSGTPSATKTTTTPSAGIDLSGALMGLLETIKPERITA
jgi:ATP-dependent Clp protease, protease subunit